MGNTVAKIILEGMTIWSTERQKAFNKKHKKSLEAIRKAQNESFPDYTDAAVMLGLEDYEDFLVAYYLELKQHNQEVLNA